MFKMRPMVVLAAAGIFISALTTSAIAGSVGFGLSAAHMILDTAGNETLKQNGTVTGTSRDAEVDIASGFIEYRGDSGFVIGYEAIPGEAELGNVTTTRTDRLTAGDVSVTQKGAAEVDNFHKWYVETPAVGWGFYGTFGISQVDLNTTESLGTGASYGNKELNGRTFGVGIRNSLMDGGAFYKLEANHTNWDGIHLKSSTDSGEQSIIDAELNTTQIKLSLGYSF